MGELEVEIASGLTESQTIISGPYDALRTLKDGDLIKTDVRKEKTER